MDGKKTYTHTHSGHQVRWTYQPGSHRSKVTQDFFIHLLSAVRALIFLARRIQPFLSLVDREIEFLCTNDFNRSPLVGHFIFIIYFIFSEKNLVYRDRTHVPMCQKVTRLPLSYRGDRPKKMCPVLFLSLSYRLIQFVRRNTPLIFLGDALASKLFPCL